MVEGRHSLADWKNVRHTTVEFVILLLGSIVVGWVIGTAQHYVAAGFFGYGFGKDSFLLAMLEGGLVGATFAIPIGLVVWYLIMKRNASVPQVLKIVFGSLLGGCILGAFMGPGSFILTPILTLVIAWFLKFGFSNVEFPE